MAFTEKQWTDAKAYYEAGLSLAQIKEKTGIARNTISQRAKREQWEQGRNADYIEARKVVASKKGTETEQSIRILDSIADDQIEVMRIQRKALKKADDMLDMLDSPNDLKTIIEAVDKASITLRVSERHAPKADTSVTVNNENTTNMQNNYIQLSPQELEAEIKRRGLPLDIIGR